LDAYTIAWVAIFLASFCRLLLPYLKKKQENPNLEFDPKFIKAFIVALILGLIASIFLISTWKPPMDVQNQVLLFANAFIYGWGQCDIIFKVVDL